MLPYHETPVLRIDHPLVHRAGVRLLIKREDLTHPEVSGNKWWKLKYNLLEAIAGGHKTILTFGGAYSNHIYATAAACSLLGLKSIGIIRGEPPDYPSPTLQFAADRGMTLHYVARGHYREKASDEFKRGLHDALGDFYLIPEGAANEEALRGCEEFGSKLNEIPADYICLPVGTGGTLAGIIRGLSANKNVIGFAVLKGGHSLREKVEQSTTGKEAAWQIATNYSYGGYAKRDERVTEFILSFRERTGIPLDFVYTGKMMCGLFDMIAKGFFERGKTIVAIHTGGMQGHSD